jgi:limonene 1,2-monooxygenase
MARYVHPYFQKSREPRRDSYDFGFANFAKFTGEAGKAVQAEIDKLEAKRAAAKRSAAD